MATTKTLSQRRLSSGSSLSTTTAATGMMTQTEAPESRRVDEYVRANEAQFKAMKRAVREALADDANDRWTVGDAKREVKDEFAFAFTRLADRTHGRCQRVDTITGRCSWVIDDPDLDRLLDEVAEGIISAGVLR